MSTTAAKKKRGLFLLVAVVLVSAFLVAPTAEASRYLPNDLTRPQAPTLPNLDDVDQVDAEAFWFFAESDVELFGLLAVFDAFEIEQLTAENRIRLFPHLAANSHPIEQFAISKLASGFSTCTSESNIWETGGLIQNCGSPSFQGLWTDPTTGIAYARNRWYDARNASWLSEDPKGAVDSVNLYAFVGWGPHMGRDPMGLREATLDDLAFEVYLTDRVGKLDRQWESRGEAYFLDMSVEWKNKCFLCTEREPVVGWETTKITTEEGYRAARGAAYNDLITFVSAVWAADDGGAIEYGNGGYFTVSNAWRAETAAYSSLLGMYNLTAGQQWTFFAAPRAIRQQHKIAASQAEYNAGVQSEALRQMNPNTLGAHNSPTASLPAPVTPPGTKPPRHINRHLAGKPHPKTNVMFDSDAYPEFPSSFSVALPRVLRNSGVSDDAQFSYATRVLWRAILASPSIRSSFTETQLRAIESGKPRIPGLTWDHYKDAIRLDLVNRPLHSKTGHTGGRAHTGGR